MNSRKMITRQSSRNTLRVDTQTDSLARDDDMSETEGAGCRDYNLNYDRAMRLRLWTCLKDLLLDSIWFMVNEKAKISTTVVFVLK